MTDEFIAESGEERDGEPVPDACVSTVAIELKADHFLAQKLIAHVIIPESSLVFCPRNSRAPPLT